MKTMKIVFTANRYLIALFFTIGLTACRSSRNGELLSSFEDVSAGHVAIGLKLNQVRTMSLNGQMPFTDIGSLYYYKPGRGNLAAVGMTLDTNINPEAFTNAHEVIQNYACSGAGTLALVKELRNKLLAVSIAAGELARLQVEKHGNNNSSGSDSAPSKDSKQNSAEPAGKTPAATVSATTPAPSNPSTSQSDLDTQIRVARTNLDTAVTNAVNALSHSNLMIFRWQADKAKSGSAAVGDAFGTNLRSELGRSGFVVVGGMRSRTLYLGEKSGRLLEREDNKRLPMGWDLVLSDWWPSVYAAGYHVVTHLWEAETIAYLSEESLLRALSAHASFEPKNINVEKIDHIAFDLAMSSISTVANAAVIQSTGVFRNPVVIGGLPRERGGGWTPIMAVTTRLRDLDELFKKPFEAKSPINQKERK